MEKIKKRNSILDIIRIFSFFCVVGVHFFLNSGFYTEIVEGKTMALMCIIRSLFIICVPMFITLTGYLMNRKELSKKYYKGITKTLIIYFLCSIVYSIFTKFYLKEEISISIFFKRLLAFKGTKYSWYIEMYIGLFCIIPFLNLIINNLKNEKQTKILLLTLIILVGLPGILNIYNFESIEWWMRPSISNEYIKIFPSWWTGIYPIFYYFLGAYLYKYKINLGKKSNLILLCISIILDGLFNYYRSYGSMYIWGSWNNYSSVNTMVITFLTFNLLLNINIKKENYNILKKISDACLGAYLISAIFDLIFYDKLNSCVINIKDRFIYAPLVVIVVFICSILLSMIINGIYTYIKLLLNKILNKDNLEL